MVRVFLLIFSLMLISDAEAASILTQQHAKTPKQLKINSIIIKPINETAFKTIGEYFGAKREHQYFRCVVRDDSKKRTGTYFIISLNRPLNKLPPDIAINLYAKTCMRNDIMVTKFKIPETRVPFSSEIYCGITSIPLTMSRLQAWKVEVVDSAGEVLCQKQSYMWH